MKRHKRHIDIDTRLDLEGPLRDVILRLQDFQEKYNDYEGVRIDEDPCYEGGYTYNLQRLETDLEYEQRLANEAVWSKRKEERERAEYERLKEKFDK
jgi:hypothetical protein